MPAPRRDVRDPSADETSALRGPTPPLYLLQIGTAETRIRSVRRRRTPKRSNSPRSATSATVAPGFPVSLSPTSLPVSLPCPVT